MNREEIGMRLINILYDMGISKDAAVGVLAIMKTPENWMLILGEIDEHPDYDEVRLLRFVLALKEVLEENEKLRNF